MSPKFKFYRKKNTAKGMSYLWTRDYDRALAALKYAESKGYKARIIESRTISGKKRNTIIYRVWRWKGKRKR